MSDEDWNLIVNYVVFGLALLIPVVIAFYHSFVKKQKNANDILMGGRSIGPIPMAFSLAVSYLSAVTLTGIILKNGSTLIFK